MPRWRKNERTRNLLSLVLSKKFQNKVIIGKKCPALGPLGRFRSEAEKEFKPRNTIILGNYILLDPQWGIRYAGLKKHNKTT